MNNHESFFQKQVPQQLARLSLQSKRQWGTMNVSQMVDHLRAGFRIMLSDEKMELKVPEEKLPKLKAFLMGERPFQEGANKPDLYNQFEEGDAGDFETLKESFLKDLAEFEKLTRTDTSFHTFHSIFGKLNGEETRQLQFKHINHHFTQFGI